jgi:hypothetical protein
LKKDFILSIAVLTASRAPLMALEMVFLIPFQMLEAVDWMPLNTLETVDFTLLTAVETADLMPFQTPEIAL